MKVGAGWEGAELGGVAEAVEVDPLDAELPVVGLLEATVVGLRAPPVVIDRLFDPLFVKTDEGLGVDGFDGVVLFLAGIDVGLGRFVEVDVEATAPLEVGLASSSSPAWPL